jgi:formylglycine-generating enzyme required for sulfatase activity
LPVAGLILAFLGTVAAAAPKGELTPLQGDAKAGASASGHLATATAPESPPRQPNACVEPGPSLAPTMVVIPPGGFWMGSPDTENGRDSDESPRHSVTIPRPFALGRCEITVGQFRRFAEDPAKPYTTTAEQPGAKGCFTWNSKNRIWGLTQGRNWRNPGFPQTEDDPVVCVSHQDADAYAAWLSTKTGASYRLPSEAEWEYAARAGTETARYWGEDPKGSDQCAFANGAGQEAKAVGGVGWTYADCRDAFPYTAPVASFRPNAFQLYDLSGNVWEWTADCWHENYQNAPVDGSPWLEANGGDCGRRVVRGGSWMIFPQALRSADRFSYTTDDAGNDLGFRIARAL